MPGLKAIFGRFLGRARPAPLRGAPVVRREKTYSAQTGFVYQYYYEGYREAARADGPGYEYVFHVNAGRQAPFPVMVFLPRAAVQQWQQAHGRALSPTEQYAAVKMSLFAAFDERPDLGPPGADVLLDAGAIEAHLAALEID